MSGKAAFRSKKRKNDVNQRLRYAQTFSPVFHGLLFYFFKHLLWRRFFLPHGVGEETEWRLRSTHSTRAADRGGVRGILGAARELAANHRPLPRGHRQPHLLWHCVLNSLADIGFMALGFWLASSCRGGPIGFELFTLAMVRKNLTLNVFMLVWPIDAVRARQAGG